MTHVAGSSGVVLVGRPPSGQAPAAGLVLSDGTVHVVSLPVTVVAHGRQYRLTTVESGRLVFFRLREGLTAPRLHTDTGADRA